MGVVKGAKSHLLGRGQRGTGGRPRAGVRELDEEHLGASWRVCGEVGGCVLSGGDGPMSNTQSGHAERWQPKSGPDRARLRTAQGTGAAEGR